MRSLAGGGASWKWCSWEVVSCCNELGGNLIAGDRSGDHRIHVPREHLDLVKASGVMAQGFGFRVSGLMFGVQGLGFRGEGLCLKV